jgi:endoglucanase
MRGYNSDFLRRNFVKDMLILLILLIALSISGTGIERYHGVNLAGGEFGFGDYDIYYTYPNSDEVDYFMSKGMNVFRLPFRWENLQPELNGPLDDFEIKRIDNFVTYVTSKGAYVILDPHNYGHYIIGEEDRNEVMKISEWDSKYKEKNNALKGLPARPNSKSEAKIYAAEIGSDSVTGAHFADFWGKLATHYKDNDRVIFGLMNEAQGLPAMQWVEDINSALKSIRDANAANLVLIQGNNWDGAYNWDERWDLNGITQASNAEAMLFVIDPSNNSAFEVHQYIDSDFSGSSDNCVSSTIGSEKLKDFTEWLRKNNKLGFLGEFAGGRNDICYLALDDMLNYIDANSDVWLGWTYWTAGPWWPKEYIFNLEPIDGKDRPQMDVLIRHIGAK